MVKASICYQKSKWLGRVAAVFVVAAGVTLFAGFMHPPTARAAPFSSCNEQAWLFQYESGQETDLISIDLPTGDVTTSVISGRRINGAGYNPLDDFIYAYDEQTQHIIRVEDDGSVIELPDPTDLPTFGAGTASYRLGAIDANGQYWLASNIHERWYHIDLAPGSPDYGQVVDQGDLLDPSPDVASGADWAFIPGHSGLFRLMRDSTTNTTQLVHFDTGTGSQTVLGDLGDLGDLSLPGSERNKFGAVYSDPDFLYGSSNFDGNIYRVDVDAVTATLFSQTPSSGQQDGARCLGASVSLDFGDGPASYGTRLQDDGPRHTFLDSLFLGTAWDDEHDAPSTLDGQGDDQDSINDEDGLASIPRLTAADTTYKLDVQVTNNTGSPATLAGWVDFNANGKFDPGERAVTSVASGSTFATLQWSGLSPIVGGSAIRLRLFSGSVSDPQVLGSASGGEVEDYNLSIVAASTPASTELAPTGLSVVAVSAIGLTSIAGSAGALAARKYLKT